MEKTPLEQAKEEFSEEQFREEVEEKKVVLRRKAKPFWKRLLNKRLIIKIEDKI